MEFHAVDGTLTGGLKIKLAHQPKYRLEWCHDDDQTLSPPDELSDVSENIWKITVTSEPGIILHVNDVEILNIELSDDACKQDDWRNYWMGVPKRIEFTKLFNDQDLYLQIGKKPCSLEKDLFESLEVY